MIGFLCGFPSEIPIGCHIAGIVEITVYFYFIRLELQK